MRLNGCQILEFSQNSLKHFFVRYRPNNITKNAQRTKYVSQQADPRARASHDFCVWSSCVTIVITAVVYQPLQFISTTSHYFTKEKTLTMAERNLIHPICADLKLIAWNLFGQTSRIKAYQNRLNNISSIRGDQQHELDTTQYFMNVEHFVVNNKPIPLNHL